MPLVGIAPKTSYRRFSRSVLSADDVFALARGARASST